MQAQAKPFTEHKASTTKSPLVEVTKTIDTPPEQIFEAWSDAKQIRLWWGPEGFECPHAEHDFRVEGKYLYCMRRPKGSQEIWSTGKFIAIEPNRKILITDLPSNARGEVVEPTEGPFADSGESFITLELTPQGKGRTQLKLTHEGLPARMHDECVDGWSSTLEKMKRLVEKH